VQGPLYRDSSNKMWQCWQWVCKDRSIMTVQIKCVSADSGYARTVLSRQFKWNVTVLTVGMQGPLFRDSSNEMWQCWQWVWKDRSFETVQMKCDSADSGYARTALSRQFKWNVTMLTVGMQGPFYQDSSNEMWLCWQWVCKDRSIETVQIKCDSANCGCAKTVLSRQFK
jgi:ABC-type transporter Mla MlaB component